MARVPTRTGISADISGRSSLEEQFQFTIIGSEVKVTEEDGKLYYTMQVRTDNESESKLENFVLLGSPEGEKVGFILTYNSGITEIKSMDEINDSGFWDVKIVYANETDPNDIGKTMVIRHYYSLCTYTGSENCGGKKCGYGVSEEVILDYFPESPGWWNGGGSGGSGGSGGPIVIVSVPVINPSQPPAPSPMLPCATLTAKTNDPVYKAKMQALNTSENHSAQHEHGFADSRENPSISTYPDIYGATPDKLNIPSTLKAIGFTHVHTDPYIDGNGIKQHPCKMPSIEDIIGLIKCGHTAELLGIGRENAYGIANSSDATYAIKLIGNPDFTGVNFAKMAKSFRRRWQTMVESEDTTPITSTMMEKMFLDLLDRYEIDTKIALLKAGNSEATSWNRITNSNQGPVAQPCPSSSTEN